MNKTIEEQKKEYQTEVTMYALLALGTRPDLPVDTLNREYFKHMDKKGSTAKTFVEHLKKLQKHETI